MKESIFKYNPQSEYYTDEGCYITELLNTPEDETASVARACVKPGVTTVLHKLVDTDERYVIIEGCGCVEIGGFPPTLVNPGDAVFIPAGTAQSISNTGDCDLVFLCICTPRFRPECYVKI